MSNHKQNEVKVNVNVDGIDEAIEKASRLKSLLEECNTLIESLNRTNLQVLCQRHNEGT